MYIGLGIVLIVIGAILSFVLQVDLPAVDDDLLGWILMGAGLLAIILSFAMRGRQRPPANTTYVAPVDETRIDPNSRY